MDGDLNKTILEAIKCPLCKKYLFPPIFQCSKGHSLCKSCRDSKCPICYADMGEERRYSALEMVCQTISYPCFNKDFGCTENLKYGEMEDHLQVCKHRQYECILAENCRWRGRKKDLIKHSINQHASNMVFDPKKIFMWKNRIVKHDVILMMAYDELFYVHRILKNDIMYWTVQYIGNSADVILYYFKVNIFTNQFENRYITFSDICHDDVKEVNDILDCGYCVAIPLSIIETYRNDYDVVFYEIAVKKA